MRVVRFFMSIYPASLPPPPSAGPRLQASSGSECFPAGSPPQTPDQSVFPPDLHRKLRIRVFPRRISTASSGSERFSSRNLHRKLRIMSVPPPDPPPQAHDQDRISTASLRIRSVSPPDLHRKAPDQSVSPPDLHRKAQES